MKEILEGIPKSIISHSIKYEILKDEIIQPIGEVKLTSKFLSLIYSNEGSSWNM